MRYIGLLYKTVYRAIIKFIYGFIYEIESLDMFLGYNNGLKSLYKADISN